ncbi:hypothetical protein E4U42_006653 [Claviceps africana]|uniref:CRAL/TRIO N-terminal domain-containing protein n=1 Tax=Claviceps africana TaxID=83212 RepID=A0A8K0JD46_9HYPO|nr:hypothetical protein E4U42_006653 [Claviceps africana]
MSRFPRYRPEEPLHPGLGFPESPILELGFSAGICGSDSRRSFGPYTAKYNSASSSGSAHHGKPSDSDQLSLSGYDESGPRLAATAPLPSSGNGRIAKLHIRSCISPSAIIVIGLSLATAVAVAFASCVPAQDDSSSQVQSDVESVLVEDMALEIPPGHRGNLTPDQEDKLRKLWYAIFKVCRVHGEDVSAPGESSVTEQSPASAKKKRGFGLFRSSQPNAATPGDPKASETVDDDKFGLNKLYQEILASQKPEDIRKAFWESMKHDHPDAVVLRFLRARKWNVDKALVMLISAANWRSSMKIDQHVIQRGEAGAVADEKSEDPEAKKIGGDFMKQLRAGKSFLHGTDKAGRSICIVRSRLHRAGEQSTEGLERYTIYVIEMARLALKPPVETAASIASGHLSSSNRSD